MKGFILGKKNKQSQTFNEKMERIPITYIKTSPCYLVDIKCLNNNKLFSLKFGFDEAKKIKKPIQGQLLKAGIKTPLRFFREFRIPDNILIEKIKEGEKIGIKIGEKTLFIGQEIKPTLFFKKGDRVSISGISKGKGFQGVVKRHGFAGGPKTHGQSDRERAPGSIGQTTTPGRIYKGKRMAGRMGNQRVTIKNLPVIDVKEEELIVKGLIPGGKGGLLEIVG